MNEVTKETLEKAYKPYDVVTNKNGDVGFIQETSVNDCQKGFNSQINYSITWIVGTETRSAWWGHHELKRHTNIFIEIAKCSCHPFGNNEAWVEKLMK